HAKRVPSCIQLVTPTRSKRRCRTGQGGVKVGVLVLSRRRWRSARKTALRQDSRRSKPRGRTKGGWSSFVSFRPEPCERDQLYIAARQDRYRRESDNSVSECPTPPRLSVI